MELAGNIIITIMFELVLNFIKLPPIFGHIFTGDVFISDILHIEINSEIGAIILFFNISINSNLERL